MKNSEKFLAIIVLLISLAAHNIFAQDTSVSYYRNELTFGMGYAYGFEKSVFNLTEDNAVESAVGININYCYYLNKEIGLGARFFGYTKELNEYYLYYPDGSTKKTTYTLSAGNLDGEFRYVFNRGAVEPYGFLLFGLTSGSASDDISDLSFSGFNIGAGAGAKLKIGERWRLSAELLGIAGNSPWKSKPFVNSSGDNFNPSAIELFINVSYIFGAEKIIKGSK